MSEHGTTTYIQIGEMSLMDHTGGQNKTNGRSTNQLVPCSCTGEASSDV